MVLVAHKIGVLQQEFRLKKQEGKELSCWRAEEMKCDFKSQEL